MIPPFLIEKAAAFAAPLAAKLTSPLVKWGAIAAGAVILVMCTWWKTYDAMRTACEEEKVIAAQQAATAAIAEQRRQLVATMALNAKISEEKDQKTRELEAFVESVRKKARKYAAVKVEIPADIVRIHDEYARMSETPPAGSTLPDSRTGGTEVQSGAVSTQAELRVQVDLGDGTVEMTLENAINMLSDTYKTLQAALRDYRHFSEWNDGREAIELTRTGNVP